METPKIKSFHTEFSWEVGGKAESKWKQARAACRELSQAKWGKTTIHGGSGYWGLLKDQQHESFYPTWLFHTLPPSLPTVRCSTGLDFPSLQRGHCCSGTVVQEVMSVPIDPLLSGTTSLWHHWPRSLGISGICLNTTFWSPGSSPTSRILSAARIFPAARMFTFHFPGPAPSPPARLFSENNSFWHQLFLLSGQTSHFPSLNSLCSEAQHVVILQIGGSASCFLINWRIQDVSFCSTCVSPKFTISLQQLHLPSTSLVLEGWRVQCQTPTPANIYPISCCQLAFKIQGFFHLQVNISKFLFLVLPYNTLNMAIPYPWLGGGSSL